MSSMLSIFFIPCKSETGKSETGKSETGKSETTILAKMLCCNYQKYMVHCINLL